MPTIKNVKDAKAAVADYLSKTGHDLCHDSRRELAEAFGLPDMVPKAPSTLDEFDTGCQAYQKEVYGRCAADQRKREFVIELRLWWAMLVYYLWDRETHATEEEIIECVLRIDELAEITPREKDFSIGDKEVSLKESVSYHIRELDSYRNASSSRSDWCPACKRGWGWVDGKELRHWDEELKRLRQHVDDLQSGMYINCVYCGHRYGPAGKTPVSMAEMLKEHIENCPQHPMSALKTKFAELNEAVSLALGYLRAKDVSKATNVLSVVKESHGHGRI